MSDYPFIFGELWRITIVENLKDITFFSDYIVKGQTVLIFDSVNNLRASEGTN